MLVGIALVMLGGIVRGGYVAEDEFRGMAWLGAALLAGLGAWGWAAGFSKLRWSGGAMRTASVLAFVGVLVALQCLPLPVGIARMLSPSIGPAIADRQVLGLVANSATISTAPEKTAEALGQWIASTCLFLAAAALATRYRGYQWLRRIVLGGMVAMATLGLLRFGFGAAGRATGTLGNPNHFAAFLAMTLPLAISQAWRIRPTRLEITGPDRFMGLAALTVVAVLAWLLSLSRGSIAAALPVWAVWLFLEFRRTARRGGVRVGDLPALFRFEALLLAVALVGLVALAAVPSALGERASTLGPSGAMRPKLWLAGLKTFADSPVLGVGMAAAEFGLNRHLADVPMRRAAVEVHNDWIQWLAELGLVGLLGTVLLTWRVLRAPDLRDGRASESALAPSSERRALAVGMLALGLHSFVDFPLRIPVVGFQALLLAALMTAPREVRLAARRRVSLGVSEA